MLFSESGNFIPPEATNTSPGQERLPSNRAAEKIAQFDKLLSTQYPNEFEEMDALDRAEGFCWDINTVIKVRSEKKTENVEPYVDPNPDISKKYKDEDWTIGELEELRDGVRSLIDRANKKNSPR